jgi:hypothetical protein
VQGVASPSAALQNWKRGETVVATVDHEGKVGIGTTEPSSKLTVSGEIKLAGYPTGIYFGNAQGLYDNGGAGLTLNVPLAASVMTLSTNDGNIVLSPGSGNVGIGTTGPSRKLTVSGEIQLSGYPTGIYFGNAQALYDNGASGLTLNVPLAASVMTLSTNNGNIVLSPGSGNVGIGPAAPAEKLDVAGNVKSDGLNKIIFLRPSTVPDHDDAVDIRDAINNKLPANGGIIMLMPGAYNIGTTVSNLIGTVAKNGVKLRGYGGGWPGTAADALTRLVWTGPAGGTVIDLKPYDPDPQVTTGQVQDLGVSDLTIDGSSSAGIGLRLDRVFNSSFRRVQIRNMSQTGGVGMKLTTTAFGDAGANKGCQYNSFEDCAVYGASKCVLLTSEPPDQSPVANACHNTFVGLSTWHYGTEVTDAGILLEDCDNNNFIRAYCWPSVEGSGFGVVIADPRNARANYFYHLQAWPRVRVNKADAPFVEQKNVIFGYDLENTQLQPEAVTSSGNPADPANFLFWIDSAASVNASELAVTEKMSKAAGAVYASANQSSVHGADTGPDRTYFTRDVSVGDKVTIVAAPTDPHPETRTVTAVNSDFLLTVDSSFTYDHGWGLLAVWPWLRLTLRVADPWGGTKLSLSNAGNLSVAGSLSIGGAEVVSDQRVLHNVTANAGIITSGAFQPSQIPNLDASKVTSGTFQAAQIPNLNASKINDGIFDLARIPTMDNAHLPADLLHGKTANGRKIAWGAAHLSGGIASVATGLGTVEAAVVTAINGTSNTFNADHSAGGGALTIGCSDGSSTEWVWWIAIGT